MSMVFTNGCFDIIHVGHIHLLKEAKSHGDFLVVGLNNDESVRQIKPNRPIMPEIERMQVLESIRYVDMVIPFSEDNPLRLIRDLRPRVLVKGGDWQEEDIIGADFVKSYGGKVVRVELKHDISTSKIIKRIRKLNIPGGRQ